MKRTKLTNFILQKLRFTGIFLYDIIYFYRLTRTLNDIKNNIDDLEIISFKNNDVINYYSKEIINNETLYKISVV